MRKYCLGDVLYLIYSIVLNLLIDACKQDVFNILTKNSVRRFYFPDFEKTCNWTDYFLSVLITFPLVSPLIWSVVCSDDTHFIFFSFCTR